MAFADQKEAVTMDYYKILLTRINDLPSGSVFTIGQAYKEGWRDIPGKDKKELGRSFKSDVDSGKIPGITYEGTVPGSVHPHKTYKKL